MLVLEISHGLLQSRISRFQKNSKFVMFSKHPKLFLHFRNIFKLIGKNRKFRVPSLGCGRQCGGHGTARLELSWRTSPGTCFQADTTRLIGHDANWPWAFNHPLMRWKSEQRTGGQRRHGVRRARPKLCRVTGQSCAGPTVAERLRRAYPAPLGRAGVGSIPANPDAQKVPSFEMKLSPCAGSRCVGIAHAPTQPVSSCSIRIP